MEKQQREVLLKILSDYQQLLIANLGMQALLEVAQKHGAFVDWDGTGTPSSWRQELDGLGKHPDMQKLRDALTPVLLQVKKAFLDSELRTLLDQIPIKGPVN